VQMHAPSTSSQLPWTAVKHDETARSQTSII
jgi:hypothetical protein